MIKAVIFDLNGIFIKGEILSKRVEEKYGIDADQFWKVLKRGLDIVRNPGCSDSFRIFQPLFRKIGFNIARKEFFEFWFSGEKLDNKFLKYSRDLRKKGLKVIILSNNFRERTQYYRKYFPKIFSNTDKAYFSWETGFVKPDVKAFIYLLKDSNLKADELIYFDDRDENVDVAKSLGMLSFKFESVSKTKRIINSLLKKGN